MYRIFSWLSLKGVPIVTVYVLMLLRQIQPRMPKLCIYMIIRCHFLRPINLSNSQLGLYYTILSTRSALLLYGFGLNAKHLYKNNEHYLFSNVLWVFVDREHSNTHIPSHPYGTGSSLLLQPSNSRSILLPTTLGSLFRWIEQLIDMLLWVYASNSDIKNAYRRGQM